MNVPFVPKKKNAMFDGVFVKMSIRFNLLVVTFSSSVPFSCSIRY